MLGHSPFRISSRRAPKPDGKGSGPYEWQTYAQVKEKMTNVGEHLVKTCGLPRGSKVGIYSMNRPEWTTSAVEILKSHNLSLILNDN